MNTIKQNNNTGNDIETLKGYSIYCSEVGSSMWTLDIDELISKASNESDNISSKIIGLKAKQDMLYYHMIGEIMKHYQLGLSYDDIKNLSGIDILDTETLSKLASLVLKYHNNGIDIVENVIGSTHLNTIATNDLIQAYMVYNNKSKEI